MSSAATTQVAEHDTASVSGSENKKRNKLGYHRTAVACGHCRRRKIRCIPSADENETRCQNCIRLKKDCQFFPIEGSGEHPREPRSNSQAGTSFERSMSRSSTSPEMAGTGVAMSYETSVQDDIVPNAAWTEAPGLIRSPSVSILEAGHNPWSPSMTPHQIQSLFPQHNLSNTPEMGTYWSPNGPNNLPQQQQQQQYSLAISHAAYQQYHQFPYGNQDMAGGHHGIAVPGFVHETSHLRRPNGQVSSTFPELARSMTMPTMHSQSYVNAEMGAQFTPQLENVQGHLGYEPAFAPQIQQRAQWYAQMSPLQEHPPHYLPSQRLQGPRDPRHPG